MSKFRSKGNRLRQETRLRICTACVFVVAGEPPPPLLVALARRDNLDFLRLPFLPRVRMSSLGVWRAFVDLSNLVVVTRMTMMVRSRTCRSVRRVVASLFGVSRSGLLNVFEERVEAQLDSVDVPMVFFFEKSQSSSKGQLLAGIANGHAPER